MDAHKPALGNLHFHRELVSTHSTVEYDRECWKDHTAIRQAVLHDMIDALRWITEKDGFPAHRSDREQALFEMWEKRLARAERTAHDA